MFSRLIGRAAVAACFCLPVNAATVSSFTNDLTFNALCTDGSNPQACEAAVGEIRSGDGGPSGDFEIGLNVPVASNTFNYFETGDVAWAEAPGVGFTFAHDGANGLTLSVGGTRVAGDLDAVGGAVRDMSAVDTLFIRTRSESATETAGLTDLRLATGAGTVSLPDNVATAGGYRNAAYLRVTDVDFSAAWTLTGTTTFAWDDTLPKGSRLGHTFKLAEISAVPLPSAFWMMLSAVFGLMGFRALRRRRRG